MRYREFAPAPALASYVRCVWTLDAGYYDRAHLAHDCRDIVGVTPSALLGGSAPLMDVFLDRGAA